MHINLLTQPNIEEWDTNRKLNQTKQIQGNNMRLVIKSRIVSWKLFGIVNIRCYV